jgi:hypothetical protein
MRRRGATTLLQIGDRALEMEALIDKFSLAARIARRASTPSIKAGPSSQVVNPVCRYRRSNR